MFLKSRAISLKVAVCLLEPSALQYAGRSKGALEVARRAEEVSVRQDSSGPARHKDFMRLDGNWPPRSSRIDVRIRGDPVLADLPENCYQEQSRLQRIARGIHRLVSPL